jgi:ATP-binding cassette subfamily F protein uup
LDKGHVITGKTVIFGHYTQQHVDFDPSKKVLEIVRDVAEFIVIADGTKLSATRLLERFMFPPKQQHSFVRFLSGGEKRRLSLLLVLLRNPNFLVLDEPTNDLDVQTIQVLEEFLLAYTGRLIVVSHDRFFVDKVVDHLFVFTGEGQIEDFW